MVEVNKTVEREISRLETKMAALEDDLKLLQGDVREIRDTLVSFKGGWRFLSIIIAVSASLGAVVAKIPDTVFFR